MVILGLGSNVSDRMSNLRRALHAIKKIPQLNVIRVSPVYVSDALLPENAPSDWDMPHLNLAIACETELAPHELLKQLKNIEWSIGRKPEVRHWGPRILDIDILAWDQLIVKSDTLTVPHENLTSRPFALWPLSDVAPHWIFPLPGIYYGKTAIEIGEQWGSRFSGDAPLRTKQIYQRVDTSQLVGILNLTPDSFSDGGLFSHPEKALAQISHLIASGAEIIDIGGESTSPKAKSISIEEEWKRISPVLELLQSHKNHFFIPPKISVDTYHPEIAEKTLNFGVDWINDVTGLDNERMQTIIANATVNCVVMHHIKIPEDRNHVLPRNADVVKTVYEWCEKKLNDLIKAGIKQEQIILDPGIGFGKLAEQSLELIKQIEIFKSLGMRLLVGHSRKTFLSLFTEKPFAERDIETLPITLYLSKHSVDYLRVHNVEMAARGLRVMSTL